MYADEQTENLFGHTQDELFGKLLRDFTDEPGQELIDQLLVPHSNFETLYETTTINLRHRDGAVQPVMIVACLNFVAGNAVNFQVVFNPACDPVTPDTGRSQQTPSSVLTPLLDMLESGVPALKEERHLKHLQGLSGASTLALYQVDGDELKLVSQYCPICIDGESSADISSAGDLAWYVAQTGENYEWCNSEHVQRAVELGVEAPSEYIRFLEDGDSRYILRLQFETEADETADSDSLARIKRVLDLMTTPVGNAEVSTPVDDGGEDGHHMPLDTLDRLGLAVCRVLPDGELVCYNALMGRMLGTKKKPASVSELIDRLFDATDTAQLRHLQSCLETAAESNDACDTHLVAGLSNGLDARVHIVAFAGENTGVWLVVLPLVGGDDASLAGFTGSARHLEEARSALAASADSLTRLGHGQYDRLNGSGRIELIGLQQNIRFASGRITQMCSLIDYVSKPEAPAIVDLNHLMSSLYNDMAGRFPGKAVNMKFGHLPKIRTARRLFNDLVASLMSVIIAEPGDATLDFAVSVSLELNTCCLHIDCGAHSPDTLRDLLSDTGKSAGSVDCSGDFTQSADYLLIDILLATLKATCRVSPSANGNTVELTVPLV